MTCFFDIAKMSVKKIIIQLEVIINLKFQHYQARFFANTFIHVGLDRALLSFDDFKLSLDEIIFYLND